MAVAPFTIPLLQFMDDSGNPLPGAKLYSFLAGTSTPAAIYADAQGITALSNPAIANAAGKLTAYGLRGQAYKLNLFSSTDVQQAGWPIDNLLLENAVNSSQLLPSPVTLGVQAFIVPAVNGAAVLTVAGFYAANVYVWDVKVEVTAQFGASQGLTGFMVGDAQVGGRWLTGATLTTGEKATLNGGMPKFSTNTDLLVAGEGGLFDATGSMTITRYTLERSGSGTGASSSTYSVTFSSQTSVTILGTSHQFGTNLLHVSVMDNNSPAAVIEPGSITIHPTTYDIVVTFVAAQSGTIIVKN